MNPDEEAAIRREYRQKVFLEGLEAIKNLFKDVKANIELTEKNLETIVRTLDDKAFEIFETNYVKGKDFDVDLAKIHQRTIAKEKGRRFSPERKAQIDKVLLSMEDGIYPARELADYLNTHDIEITPASIGIYLARHKNKDKLGFRYLKEERTWEKKYSPEQDSS